MPRDEWKRANERATYGPAKARHQGRKRKKKGPKCPRCGKRMVLRTNSEDGSQFHGCPSWPYCAGKKDAPKPAKTKPVDDGWRPRKIDHWEHGVPVYADQLQQSDEIERQERHLDAIASENLHRPT